MVARVRDYDVSQTVDSQIRGTEKFAWLVANHANRVGVFVFSCQHLGEGLRLPGPLLTAICSGLVSNYNSFGPFETFIAVILPICSYLLRRFFVLKIEAFDLR